MYDDKFGKTETNIIESKLGQFYSEFEFYETYLHVISLKQ